MENYKTTLPSGAELEIMLAPFEVGKSLYQVVAKEALALKIDPTAEIDVNLWKDIVMTALASKDVDKALWACMARATYNKTRITPPLFEDPAAREDYLEVCFEVAGVNLRPFMKNLFVRFKAVYGEAQSFLSSMSKRTAETPTSPSTSSSAREGTQDPSEKPGG